MSETQRFLVLSVLIGAFAGLLITIFHIAIETVSWWTLGWPPGESTLATVISPCLGAGVAGLFVRFAAPSARGSGINYTKAAIYISDGFIPASSVAGKFTACAASIGAGAPLGPEDPALQMGAGIASVLGRRFGLPRESMRHIAPIGAAAGIAAAFNTPITAVLFVIEEVLSGWSAGVFGSIVLSAVSATVVTRVFLGDEPLFRVPAMTPSAPSDLLIYAAIGVLAGGLGAVYSWSLAALRGRVKTWPPATTPLLPFAAGLLTGVVAVVIPGVLGAGYGGIDAALHGEFGWSTLIALAVAKAVLTAISFGCGVPGGLFAPTLFVGAMIGGGLGAAASIYWPAIAGSTGTYVLVGMGAFFAAVFRTPMTAIFMVFEVSATYLIILPVMVASTVSYLVARALRPHSLFEIIGLEEGLRFPSVAETRARRGLRVEDAMRPYEGPAAPSLPRVHPDEPLDVAIDLLRSYDEIVVTPRGAPARIVGRLTRAQLLEWLWPGQPVAPTEPSA